MKKNIIVINSLGSGGAERIAVLFANYLITDNTKVRVIVLDNIKNSYDIDSNVEVSYLGFGNFFRIFFPITFIIQSFLLYRALNSESNTSNVYAFLHRAGFITALASYFNRSDFVYTERSITDKSYSGIRLMIMKFFLKFTYHKAKKIIAISSLVKRKISEISHVESKIVVIPNPVDSKEFFLDPNQATTLTEPIKIIVIGRLIASKRVDSAIIAFEKLSLSEPYKKFSLDILGNGDELSCLKEMARNSKCSDSISFLGHVSKPTEYLQRAHICLICSEHESFGNTALEATACGTMVVYPSDLESMNEIFFASPFGISYSSREPEIIVSAIKKALGLYEKINANDYKNFINNFSVLNSFTKYKVK